MVKVNQISRPVSPRLTRRILLVLLVAVIATIMFGSHSDHASRRSERSIPVLDFSTLYELDPINISTIDGRSLQIEMFIEPQNPEDLKHFRQHEPAIKDAASKWLQKHSYRQLSLPQRQDHVQQSLQTEIKRTVGIGRVKKIYFNWLQP